MVRVVGILLMSGGGRSGIDSAQAPASWGVLLLLAHMDEVEIKEAGIRINDSYEHF